VFARHQAVGSSARQRHSSRDVALFASKLRSFRRRERNKMPTQREDSRASEKDGTHNVKLQAPLSLVVEAVAQMREKRDANILRRFIASFLCYFFFWQGRKQPLFWHCTRLPFNEKTANFVTLPVPSARRA